MKYLITYLTRTLGKIREEHGYSDEEDLADEVRQIEDMGCTVIEVVQLPHKG